MLARCSRPTHAAFKNYGGRGISVCPEWAESFEAFWADMGPTYKPGLTLDREDNDGNYTPTNCRWATHTTQARNRRRSRVVQTPWGEMSTAELSERTGLGMSTIYYRLARNVTPEQLVAEPDVSRRFMTS
jgi:hypothetical protein